MSIRKRTRARLIGRGALAVLALFGVTPAHTAGGPAVTCLNGWGARQPVVWCDPSYRGTVWPMDQASGYGEMGVMHVRGVASPGTIVRLTVTDGTRVLRGEVFASDSADSGTHQPAGAFALDFHVTDLGVHRAAEGAEPDTATPDQLGKSVLVLSGVAIGPATEAVSSPLNTTVTKYAATPFDFSEPPDVFPMKGPPTSWCHANISLICTPNPCPGVKSIQQTISEQIPPDSTIPYDSLPPPVNTLARQEVGLVRNSLKNQSGQIFLDPCSTGEAIIAGTVNDFDPFASPSAAGASEIADVHLVLSRGDQTIVDTSILAARTTGTTAVWSYVLKIKDFTPNPNPFEPQYVAHVDVIDAWGNTVPVLYAFRVYPW